MITITLSDGTKISGDKDEVLDAYFRITGTYIRFVPDLPDDYPMPNMPWEPKTTWTLQ